MHPMKIGNKDINPKIFITVLFIKIKKKIQQFKIQ